MKVGVLDYGVGNLGSVLEAVSMLRAEPVAVTRALDVHGMDCLVLPGVGHFADCRRLLDAGGWTDALRDAVLGRGRPLLGICVGMQLLADSSDEGADANGGEPVPGLGLVPGRVRHLRSLGCGLRTPHVGWNGITPEGVDPLLDGLGAGTDVYFVHSYALVADDPADVIATAEHGVRFAAAVRRSTVWGTQFHPEKSSRAGLRVLANFLGCGAC
jgi:glutamine amidotransferase